MINPGAAVYCNAAEQQLVTGGLINPLYTGACTLLHIRASRLENLLQSAQHV